METVKDIECDVREKWQQTGLLDGATNPQPLAHILEAATTAVINAQDLLEKEHASYMITTILPILTRALREKDFTTNMVETQNTIESVFVKPAETEEDQILECKNVANNLKQIIDKYSALNISTVRVSHYENGYNIGLDCSSNLN